MTVLATIAVFVALSAFEYAFPGCLTNPLAEILILVCLLLLSRC